MVKRDESYFTSEKIYLFLLNIIFNNRDPVDCFESNYVYMGLQKVRNEKALNKNSAQIFQRDNRPQLKPFKYVSTSIADPD